MHAIFSWPTFDRAHERRVVQQSQFDEKVAELVKEKIQTLRTQILSGDTQTINDVANAMIDIVADQRVMGGLVRTALACEPSVAGQRFTELLKKHIAEDAEIDAIKEVERLVREQRADVEAREAV